MPKRVPGSREEDSWFSEDQLEGLERADEADELRTPIPTQMVSNGEYLPNPQTPKQKEVEARILAYADSAAKKLGVSRRKFLASSGGIAASFLAMNEAHGIEYFKVSKDELFEPRARRQRAAQRSLRARRSAAHGALEPQDLGPGAARDRCGDLAEPERRRAGRGRDRE